MEIHFLLPATMLYFFFMLYPFQYEVAQQPKVNISQNVFREKKKHIWDFECLVDLAFLVQLHSIKLLYIKYEQSPSYCIRVNDIKINIIQNNHNFRSLIFPFLIRGGKPTPMFPFCMALAFCLINGALQCGYLMEYADFGDRWMYNPRFYLGTK